MPKGTFTGFLFRGERLGGSLNPNASRVGIWAGQLTVGHHSNGQDGCLFTPDTLIGDDCVGPLALSKINRIDGSFSTKRFAGSAIKRVGRDRFVRNVAYALGNSGNREAALPVIEPPSRATTSATMLSLSSASRLVGPWALTLSLLNSVSRVCVGGAFCRLPPWIRQPRVAGPGSASGVPDRQRRITASASRNVASGCLSTALIAIWKYSVASRNAERAEAFRAAR